MYKLIVSELAHQDLENIVAYISVKLANPTAASSFLAEVDGCYSYLKATPMMYETCQDNHLKKAGYRKAPIKNYILIYKINEDTKTVNIMRFFYSAQDYIRSI
ncbi:MAG: type II toxin-antitoxin system RelE/ParE family toxin [Sporomusaceae bacterium]|jgi:plasmid stabilization system protein ParE|nr:type II toxin-antitoxin system RelE/ParE family toxin [Sporomusaceae bacterium]